MTQIIVLVYILSGPKLACGVVTIPGFCGPTQHDKTHSQAIFQFDQHFGYTNQHRT